MATTKRPVGRPTKYTEDTPDKAWHYVENYQDYGDVVPMVAGLAVALGISKETVYAWAREPEKRQFSDALEAIEVGQHKALVNGSLSGTYNSTIAKLMLSSNHGYSEKQEIDQTVKGNHTHTVNVNPVDKFADILKDYDQSAE
jgi:hypothetical protein